MEPATKPDLFYKEIDFRDLEDRKDRACTMFLYNFYTCERTFIRWFSFSTFRRSIRFSSLRFTL